MARGSGLDGDEALVHERDRLRMGADAVARDAARAWEALKRPETS